MNPITCRFRRPLVAFVRLALLLLVACGRRRSDAETVINEEFGAKRRDTRAAEPWPSGPERRVEPMTTASKNAPVLVHHEVLSSLTAGTSQLYGIATAHLVLVKRPAWSLQTLAPADRWATLLPHANTLFVASPSGLERVTQERPTQKYWDGILTRAVIDGDIIYWSDCREGRGCSIGRTNINTETSQPITNEHFDVVHDLAVWNGNIWIAGRYRSNRDAPLSNAEEKVVANWYASERTAAAPNGLYPSGYLATIDPRGEVT